MAKSDSNMKVEANPFGGKRFRPEFPHDLQVMCSWGEMYVKPKDKNYYDELWIFPKELFRDDAVDIRSSFCFYTGMAHRWREERNIWHALLTVKNNVAILDDTDSVSQELNAHTGGESGVITIEFFDNSRVEVKSIKWTPRDGGREWAKGYLCSWNRKDLKRLPEAADRKFWEGVVEIRTKQQQFRREVIESCKEKCCVTGNEVLDALDAAHILSFSGKGASDQTNGILLRADIHRLFDRGLLAIEPTNNGAVVRIRSDLQKEESAYRHLHDKEIWVPQEAAEALKEHYKSWARSV